MINQSAAELVWTEDGLTFTEAIRQEYQNTCLSAGFVEGHPVDSMYLKLERDGHIDTFLLLRPDEMAAIGWLASGVLWSLHIGPGDDAPDEAEWQMSKRVAK